MIELQMTNYYTEFLKYYKIASWQQENCNLGNIKHADTPFDDDMFKTINSFDVVERKYSYLTALLVDMFYNVDTHPIKHKLTEERKAIIDSFNDVRTKWTLDDWLYIFFVHRLTGSGINYALKVNGYHNSILLKFNECNNLDEMAKVIQEYNGPIFTSKGYQIAMFPKPQDGFTKGGIWFLVKVLPDLVRNFSKTLKLNQDFRNIFEWLKEYNIQKEFRVFKFLYVAVLGDIADFFPKYINKKSHFFYGTNAIECLSYMAKPIKGVPKLKLLDMIMDKIYEDTGAFPYNAEDSCCDCIRWIENNIDTSRDYSGIDLDKIWSSHNIIDHPYGRQKAMLELKLIDSFNSLQYHPSDDKILSLNNLTVDEYKQMVKELNVNSI